MKNEKYFLGLDIGTDSVGYAVTDLLYNLCKHLGEAMWGVHLFEQANLAVERRGFRVARRRLDRRQQRVSLVMDIFAYEISKVDENFFRRIKESYLYPDDAEGKMRLFDTYEQQKAYVSKYPTIHHLIVELMNSTEPHDVRLVYIACAWLVAHRGHFLSEVDKHSVNRVTDFSSVYKKLVDFIRREGYDLPWSDDVDLLKVEDVLKARLGVNRKSKQLGEVLFNGAKVPNTVDERYEYNYSLILKLLCGGKCALSDIFDKDEYGELEEKSVALGMDDEKLAVILQSIEEEDAEFILVLKSVYDWSVLVDILKGKETISDAKVMIYEQHQQDLKNLKSIVKKYVPDKYNAIFRSETIKNNYVAYIGKNKTGNEQTSVKKAANREDFCKYISSILKTVTPDAEDADKLSEIISRLEAYDFMPKQVDGDNRVIPYQLYWYEINKILENAKTYLPFLRHADEDGITAAEKVISIFEFRVPYYVGPLKEKSDAGYNHWMLRKAEGKIYPWNFDKMVDLDASEDAFISRMTNTCSYLPKEDVLPKNSLVYCAFEVLNEINNIKINGNDIPVKVKQGIYNDVFMHPGKVTPKRIKNYLISNNYMSESDIISGLDITVKSSLKPFLQFKNLISSGLLTYKDAEKIITRATYSEDRSRFVKWLIREFPALPESEIKYVSGLKFMDFGRLSRAFLCGVEGTCKESGEVFTVIRAMWETNCNLMQLLSDRFTFKDSIEEIAKEYYGSRSRSVAERLDEMHISNSVKRPIIRSLDIIKDVVKIKGRAPEKIFIEMARGSKENEKGKRTSTRLQQIRDLYEKVDTEDVRELSRQLDDWGDAAHNKLQSDKLFLYFIQLGKCLYTGNPIDIESVISGDGKYNIEHIYPRSVVKDDSVINNEILVESEANGDKSDSYPVDREIQNKMRGYWTYLNEIGLLSDEKFKRLIRNTHFTDEERYEFINRQLVETRQSTKALATILKEMYPESEIIYVKAGLVSDFRHEFNLLKSRLVNDLHHAKDAYLNIVVGNVWHSKFSRQFWRKDIDRNVKPDVVFTHPVVCQGREVWRGGADKDRVVKIAGKKTAHFTRYSFCRKGGFFDQMPVPAAKGLTPLKKGMPTEIYGGYNKSTATFFVLVRYKVAKKQDIMVMPVELMYADEFLHNDVFAEDYAKKTIESIINKPVSEVTFLLNKRIIKINTVLSLDGLRVCISGKSSGGRTIGVSLLTAFKTSPENESYVKRLESFGNKKGKNGNIQLSEKYDGITSDKNLALYDCYVQKLNSEPYIYRPANPREAILKCRENFKLLSPEEQVKVLLQIQGLFGRATKADLTSIGGVANAGVTALSSSVSNWKKNYKDVRIIDTSASGLFEKVSENLLDLL